MYKRSDSPNAVSCRRSIHRRRHEIIVTFDTCSLLFSSHTCWHFGWSGCLCASRGTGRRGLDLRRSVCLGGAVFYTRPRLLLYLAIISLPAVALVLPLLWRGAAGTALTWVVISLLNLRLYVVEVLGKKFSKTNVNGCYLMKTKIQPVHWIQMHFHT